MKRVSRAKAKPVFHDIPIISIFGIRQTSISNSRRTFPLSSIDLHRRVYLKQEKASKIYIKESESCMW